MSADRQVIEKGILRLAGDRQVWKINFAFFEPLTVNGKSNKCSKIRSSAYSRRAAITCTLLSIVGKATGGTNRAEWWQVWKG